MTVAAISSIVVFLVMFGLVITEKFEKHYVTLTCAGVMLIVVFGAIMRDGNAIADTLNFYSLVNPNFWIGEAPDSSGIDWATIIFLGGMMIMVEGLSIAGFFRWLCMTLAKAVKYKKMPLFITFMIVATILSMFIDSITVILFLARVTVELAKLLDFNPVPMILSNFLCQPWRIRNNVWRSTQHHYRIKAPLFIHGFRNEYRYDRRYLPHRYYFLFLSGL